MAKGFMIRTPHGLVVDPDDDRSRDLLRGAQLGSHVEVEVRRPRNLQHHRLFWKLCSVIAESVPGFQTAENVAETLKLATGHYTTIKGKRDLYRIPKSISFAAMDQSEFSAFFERVCQVVCSEWIPHLKADALRDDILRMVGVPVEEKAA